MAVHVSIDASVATITLDRPRALNAVDEEMLAELDQAVGSVADDERVKAVLVTGAGEAFCVGLDLGLLERAFADPAYFRTVLERFKGVLIAIEALPVPVIAAVNGVARAGGFELLLACDIVLAAEQARIGDTHLAFGIVPGGGATQRAPRKLGWQRAIELILSGRWMDGGEAARIGLALRAVDGARLMDDARALAASFASLSRPCIAATKAAMRDGGASSLGGGLTLEIDRFMRYLETVPDAREGFDAWREGRAPTWP